VTDQAPAPADIAPVHCRHEIIEVRATGQRQYNEELDRFTDMYICTAEARCARCGHPFEWIWVGDGYGYKRPAASHDRLELRAPLQPQDPGAHHDH
jgi:hypothetical protein